MSLDITDSALFVISRSRVRFLQPAPINLFYKQTLRLILDLTNLRLEIFADPQRTR